LAVSQPQAATTSQTLETQTQPNHGLAFIEWPRLIESTMLFHHVILLFCYNGANERTIEVRHFHIIIKASETSFATPDTSDSTLILGFYHDKSNHNRGHPS
jgi:tRNA A37 threonylcarbamoyladenosine biosynthesis protein TsaE